MAIAQLVLLAAAAAAALSCCQAVHPKFHQTLERNLRKNEPVDVMITLKGGNTRAIHRVQSKSFRTRSDRTSSVVQNLRAIARQSQRNIFSLLTKQRRLSSLSAQSFWITNQVFIEKASRDLMEKLVQLDEVETIRPPHLIRMDPMPQMEEVHNSSALEWGIERIQADAVWESGNTGQGIIVASLDTGVRGTHEALKDNFLGDFGWFDPYEKTTVPTDGNGHGTHTMGTMVGKGGIGVAPGAKWMSCRGCYILGCSETGLLGCAEYFTCPTDPTGAIKDCSKAPHIINNSWGGGRGQTYFKDVVKAWHEAGIIPVFSNGNSGPSCGTANSPGDLSNVIAVGSTTIGDEISSFSSKGPSVTGLLKPQISAPGSAVRSATHTSDDSYKILDGTSMAAPHVTGVIALMKSMDPELTYDRVLEIITSTADRDTLETSGMTCGTIDDTTFPNNIFGHGRINARKAVTALVTPPPVAPPVKCIWSWRKFICSSPKHCRWSWRRFSCVSRQ